MKIKKVMLGAALVLAGLVFSACANSAIGESTTTTSDVSHVIGVTHSTKQQLLAAFIAYKTTYSGMTSQDAIMWSTYNPYVVKSVPVEAWDATTRKFYALGLFTFTGKPASRLGISFQDGGDYGIFIRSPGGSWVVEPFNAVPMCSSVFPQVVATLWHFVDAGACSNPQ
jgi:hypothetical protein